MMSITQGTAVLADDTTVFQTYQEKLDESNEEFGTSYQLVAANGETYDDMVSYFLNMSLDEFEDYIRECHKADIQLEESMEFNSASEMSVDSSNPIELQSTLSTQKYFYYGNSNYLYIKTYTTTVSGVTVYTGDVSAIGSSISTYPGYQSLSTSTSFASDKRTVLATYKCYKYLSKYVTDATSYILKVTFTAGAGNIYLST